MTTPYADLTDQEKATVQRILKAWREFQALLYASLLAAKRLAEEKAQINNLLLSTMSGSEIVPRDPAIQGSGVSPFAVDINANEINNCSIVAAGFVTSWATSGNLGKMREALGSDVAVGIA